MADTPIVDTQMNDISCNYDALPFQFVVSSTVHPPSAVFHYSSSNTDVATIDSSGWINVKKIGTTNIEITEIAYGLYLAGSISANLIVEPVSSPFTFSVPSEQYLDASLNLEHYTDVFDSSLGAISYGIVNATPSDVALLDGSIITIINPGTFQIAAQQSDNGNYLGKTITTDIITVPDRAFISFNPPNVVYSDLSYSLYDWTIYLDYSCVLAYSIVNDTNNNANIGIVNNYQYIMYFTPPYSPGEITIKAEVLAGENHSGNSVVRTISVLPRTV